MIRLDEFSMSATSILPARSQILKLKKEELIEPAVQQVLAMCTAEEVKTYMKKNFIHV